jgi:hypothetical protein
MKMGSRPRILPEAIAIVAAVLVASWAARASGAAAPHVPQDSAEDRAVAWLSAEVPKWHAENSCYSCHNNGDAVRALVQAAERGHDVAAPLADTLAFLQKPADWERNSRGGALDDQGLARIQFAAALTDAAAAGLASKDPLAEAAALVAGGQADDGSWHLDESNSLGSPATYGRALATWSARRSLLAARAASNDEGSAGLTAAIARADTWVRTLTPRVTPDVAAVLLVLADATDAPGIALRASSLETLLANQNRAGGWGPYHAAKFAGDFSITMAYRILSSYFFQPACLKILFKSPCGQLITGFPRHRHTARLLGVFVLPMTAFRRHKEPLIFPKLVEQFSNFHRVILP